MNQFPIDMNIIALGAGQVVGIEPVVDFDTGAPKLDRDGIRKWKIQFVYKAPGARKKELVEVGFSAATEPAYESGSVPVFSGLVGRLWSNENAYGHSAGVALSAEKVGFRTAPTAAAPSTTAAEPKAA